MWRVKDFGGRFCPILGQKNMSFYLGPLVYILMKKV